jgi:PASTA domain
VDRVGLHRSGMRVRWVAGVAAAAVVVAGMALLGDDGYVASHPELTSGRAWLASPTQGLVTLVDGASEDVVASVRPGASGGAAADFSVVQAGSNAYVLDAATGSVSRVDGGTYAVSAPIQFGTGKALSLLAGGPGLFVVDGARRTASVTDPKTLRVRRKLTLAAQPRPGQSVVDSTGRLWVVDSSGVSTFDTDGKKVWPDLGGAGSRLVLVQGQPVLIDPARSRLGRLRPDGGVVSWACLDLTGGDDFQLLGSSSDPYVYAAVRGTGTLLVAAVTGGDCGIGLDVGKPGDTFGALAEAGGYVFVPDRSTGHAIVLDTAARQVVADLPVLDPGRKLELIAKDGVVFYNDLGGDRAGVLRLVGERWVAGKSLRKFRAGELGEQAVLAVNDPRRTPRLPDAAPLTGRDKPTPNQPSPPAVPTPPAGNQPDPAHPDDPATAPPPGGLGPAGPDPGSTAAGPDNGDPGAPGGPTDPGLPTGPGPTDPPPTDPATSSPPSTDPSPPAVPPTVRSIRVDPDPIVRELPATFSAVVDNNTGASWAWSVTAADGTPITTASTAGTFGTTFPTGSPDRVVVHLTVTTPSGSSSLDQAFTTTSQHVPSIGSIAADPPNPAAGQQVTFTATEPVAGAAGGWDWTVTALDGGTGGQGPTRQAAQTPFRYTLPRPAAYRVTLTVTYDGASDTKFIDISATDRCTITAITGSPVGLRTADQATVQAQVSGCFTAGSGNPTVTRLADFLHLVGALSVAPDGNGGGTASVTIGTGPGEPPSAITMNALRLELPNGAGVDWSVQTLDPTPTVPDLIGSDLGAAVTQLRGLGYDANPMKSGQRDDCRSGGEVAAQSPAPGTSAPRGTVVTLHYIELVQTRPPTPCGS